MIINLANNTLLDAAALKEIIPVNHETIKRWVIAGKFPAPVKVWRRSFWRSDEVRAWMDGLSAHRDVSTEATAAASTLVAEIDTNRKVS